MIRNGENNRMIDLHKAREKILDMVANDAAEFEVDVEAISEFEVAFVKVRYEIIGVQYDQENSSLKIVVYIKNIKPVELDVKEGKVYDAVERNLGERLGFLIKDTFYISLDPKSIREINKKMEMKKFKMALEHEVERRSMPKEGVLNVLMDYIKETLPETDYRTVEDIGKKKSENDGIVMKIYPPAVPCPHCDVLLTEDDIEKLKRRLYKLAYGLDWNDF